MQVPSNVRQALVLASFGFPRLSQSDKTFVARSSTPWCSGLWRVASHRVTRSLRNRQGTTKLSAKHRREKCFLV
ncbi:hypothetical protein Nmel_002998 [Mimus melanotis]